jgi:hypothetical protein
MPPLEMEIYLRARADLLTPPFERTRERLIAAYVVRVMLDRFTIEDDEAAERMDAVIDDTEEA